jgi:flavorubredoxin
VSDPLLVRNLDHLVDEMLVPYLPKDKLLFVSDLFSIPPQGPIPPARLPIATSHNKLKKLGLDVQIIAPGHGRIGTIEDLQKALDTPAPH